MAESNWNLDASEEAGMIEELRKERIERRKEDIAEEKWHEYNHAHEHTFSADIIKARRER